MFKYGSEKFPQERKLKGKKVLCGANVPRVRKFHGAKVLGTFAPEEQKFHGTKFLGLFAPREQMFHGTKVMIRYDTIVGI